MTSNDGRSGPASGGPWVVLIAISAFFLVIVLVVGGAVALRIGPFARPPGTPSVSATARASEMPTDGMPTDWSPTAGGPFVTPSQPTVLPTEPTQTERPIESPGSPLSELLSHVPDLVLPSCEATEPDDSSLAAVSCSTDSGAIAVRYLLYASVDELSATYDKRFRGAEIDADSGRCYDVDAATITATPNRWPAEHDYSIGGQPVGRYLCLETRDGFGLFWTDQRFGILGIAEASADNLDRLVRFWLNEAGPT